jgi:uncharacterized protein YndB with AHSA1/START domain
VNPLEVSFTVACPPAHAFSVWAERTALWWPPGHSVSGAPVHVGFEPRAGGRIFERTADGTEHDWGEVLAWEPPHRLRYLWHLRFDRADATEVEVTFTAAERRERNRRGWAGLLPHFASACTAQPA